MSKPVKLKALQLVAIYCEREIAVLTERRRLMVNYLQMKVTISDWHGVADAAMDLREIEAMLVVLNAVQKERREEAFNVQRDAEET